MKGLKPAEALVLHQLLGDGFKVLRNGWPDFLCVDEKTGKSFGVEVKWSGGLSPAQKAMHAALTYSGIEVRTVFAVPGHGYIDLRALRGDPDDDGRDAVERLASLILGDRA